MGQVRKGGKKDDSRKPSNSQKSSGLREAPFSMCKRKVCVFRSSSEASGGEYMMQILSPSPRIHLTLCIHSWPVPSDSSYIQKLGQAKPDRPNTSELPDVRTTNQPALSL